MCQNSSNSARSPDNKKWPQKVLAIVDQKIMLNTGFEKRFLLCKSVVEKFPSTMARAQKNADVERHRSNRSYPNDIVIASRRSTSKSISIYLSQNGLDHIHLLSQGFHDFPAQTWAQDCSRYADAAESRLPAVETFSTWQSSKRTKTPAAKMYSVEQPFCTHNLASIQWLVRWKLWRALASKCCITFTFKQHSEGSCFCHPKKWAKIVRLKYLDVACECVKKLHTIWTSRQDVFESSHWLS